MLTHLRLLDAINPELHTNRFAKNFRKPNSRIKVLTNATNYKNYKNITKKKALYFEQHLLAKYMYVYYVCYVAL